MKKLVLIMCFISLIFMCGCGRKTGENFTKTERFTIVSGKNPNAPYFETIIVDEETGVMYLAVYAYNHFGITSLLNADGTPMLAEEGDIDDSKPCNCPLVPVPPHGDLIDRDETIEAGKSHPTYKNSKIVKAVVDKACCFLKTVTVVIPANKEY